MKAFSERVNDNLPLGPGASPAAPGHGRVIERIPGRWSTPGVRLQPLGVPITLVAVPPLEFHNRLGGLAG